MKNSPSKQDHMKMPSTEDKSFMDLERAMQRSLKNALNQNTLRNIRNYCTIRNITTHRRLSIYLKSAWRSYSECSEYEDEARGLLCDTYEKCSYEEEKELDVSDGNISFMKKAGRILLASLKAHAECYNPALALDSSLPPSLDMICNVNSQSIWNE